MPSRDPPVKIDSRQGATWVRINRPDTLNALSAVTLAALAAAIESARDADVIVITGVGRAFCAGADLGTEVNGATVAAAGELVALIAAVPAPVICCVRRRLRRCVQPCRESTRCNRICLRSQRVRDFSPARRWISAPSAAERPFSPHQPSAC